MVDVITAHQMNLLAFVSKNPGITRDRLLQTKGTSPSDISYLESHDLIREREPQQYRVSHFGEMALRRGL